MGNVRRTAVDKVADQALLVKIAAEAKDENVRRAAVEEYRRPSVAG